VKIKFYSNEKIKWERHCYGNFGLNQIQNFNFSSIVEIFKILDLKLWNLGFENKYINK